MLGITNVLTFPYTPNSHLASMHCDLRTWQLETLGEGQRWDSEAAAPQWTAMCLVFSILPFQEFPVRRPRDCSLQPLTHLLPASPSIVWEKVAMWILKQLTLTRWSM